MRYKVFIGWIIAAGVVTALIFLTRNPATNSPVQMVAQTGLPGDNLGVSPPPSSAAEAAQIVSRNTAELNNKLFRTVEALWNEPVPEETFARFKDWTRRYVATAPTARTQLLGEGVELATTRRVALKELIQNDPERALELTIPSGVRSQMPGEVASLMEERINARGKLEVLGVLPEPGREGEIQPTIRVVSIGGKQYKTFTYGARLGVPTRNSIALNGIAVDNVFAFSENALKILDTDETAAAMMANPDALCSVSAQSARIIRQEVAAEVGGEIIFYCRPDHAVKQNDKIVAADGGPPSPDGGAEALAWTEGQKKLLFIRVDFSDLVGVGLSDGGVVSLINSLNSFYAEMSYGRAGFASNGLGSDFTPVFRMPQPAAYYGTNDFYNQLRSDARGAAATAGYILANYDLDVICFGSVPGWGWAGLGYVGSSGSWLRNSFGTGVAAHELGHNYGLNHANFWNTGGASVIGPGSSSEYGDSFDTMGAASAGNNHFNARYKSYLNWLTTNEVVTATTNGTYRISCHDNANSTGIRALQIPKGGGTNYWVEFRQKFTGNKWMMSGAGLRWALGGNQKSHLLDTTPGSTDGNSDSPIVIGRTFSDTIAGIHITPLSKGGTTPESLDVVVNFGSFPSNHPPVLDINATATNVGTNVGVTLSAMATDADGDTLAYHWDFGDGNIGTNSPSAGKSWSAEGDYLVRCVATDMKGGEASKWVIVRVGDPATFRIAGNISTVTNPVQGVRVHVSTTRMAYTDSDGNYTITALPAGAYAVNASLYEYTFVPDNFTNTVSVGPDATGIDFVASVVTYPPTITTQPQSRTVVAGSSVTFNVVASGSSLLTYQWRLQGTNIPGATATNYTVASVQPTNTGNYSVVITNPYGTITSANASLSLGVPPAITTQPQSQRVIAGNTVTLSVVATGTPRLNYQWRHNGTNIYGENPISGGNGSNEAYTRTNVQPIHAGGYSVVIGNSYGSITSATAQLTVSLRPQLSTPQLIGGFAQFTLSGSTGDLYSVETSTNLLNWNPAATVTNLTGNVMFVETNAALLPKKFYRGRLVE